MSEFPGLCVPCLKKEAELEELRAEVSMLEKKWAEEAQKRVNLRNYFKLVIRRHRMKAEVPE
jgi:hypothetical protein